jgi:aryl-alcohol dehydrogenase-like predicted oxidoreductase
MSDENDNERWSPTRREVIAGGLGAAASIGAGGFLASAAQAARRPPGASELITKVIPRTGARVPAIGLGTFMTFDTLPGVTRPGLTEVIRRFHAAGGRVIDTAPPYGHAEVNVGQILQQQRLQEELFIADKISTLGEYLNDVRSAEASVARSYERLGRSRPFDVLQCHTLNGADAVVPLLHALKREGRTAMIGVTHHEPAQDDILAGWVERADVDFVQLHYSIASRSAEERLLKVAADRGVAVLVNMSLEKARLHAFVGDRPVPEFAREIGIETWTQYFLKWVISHPAVTVALPATSNPAHLDENVSAMRGELPDAKLRRRMLRHMQSMRGFEGLTRRPWYPGKSYPGLVTQALGALRQRSPWWPSEPTA